MNVIMKSYAILLNPGHNRVYFKSSAALAESELAVAAQQMSSAPCDIVLKQIAAVDYLTFSAESALTPGDIEILSNLSFVYAIFEIMTIGGNEYLLPIKKTNMQYVDESISSILKYTGKTNEIFTRMMLNAAYYTLCGVRDTNRDTGACARDIRLLDPVAGKGTTLYEGLIKGFNVYGIEIGDKVVSEVFHFMKKFLETGKYKHQADQLRISGPNKSFISVKYSFDIARTKEEYKNEGIRRFEIIAGNSLHTNIYYKKNYFDMIVGDLPYGVQHGSVSTQKQSSLTRNPAELLEHCLPIWAGALKPDGVIALSWNTNVLPRTDIERLLVKNDFIIQNGDAYLGFAHRVDQSIIRDVVVAVMQK